MSRCINEVERNYKKWMWWGGGVAVILVLVVIGVVIGRMNDGEKKASEVTESEIVEKEKQEAPETEQATSDASESDEKMAEYRRQKIGFVFQHFNLIPTLTVYENIILPIILDKRKEEETYILQLLEKLGLSEKKDAYPHQLSGGQQQRVAIARAFANKPEVILADEPTGNLDSKTGQDVVDLLLKMHEVYKQTIIMITHNEKIAQYADIVIRIKDGTILNGRKV